MAKKILFVEDEHNLQKALGDVLKREGYDVIQALDGELGFELAKAKQPNLILLDLVLPKMNGFEVLKKLKTEEETKAIPVIILTNLENAEDVEKALRIGATTYLVKMQYDVLELVKKVKGLIGK